MTLGETGNHKEEVSTNKTGGIVLGAGAALGAYGTYRMFDPAYYSINKYALMPFWAGLGVMGIGAYSGINKINTAGSLMMVSPLAYPMLIGSSELGMQAFRGAAKGVRYAMSPTSTVPIPGTTGCHWVPLQYSKGYF